jgi:hypothetical protein
MTDHPLAGPVALLLAWSMVMLVWMYATRIPAMQKAGVDLKNRVGGGGKDLDSILPAEVQWKSHNYNHLMEQPTLFYATCLLLMILGHEGSWVTTLAWTYVVFRIAHSVVQSTSNRIRYRFLLFALASVCLIGLVGYTFGVVVGG